ncbi:glycine dehydrogenase (aminomethyl-transferring) [Segetibacter sp. 3557_3]|uniref:aminomethyl-transferring glycine dehydrogenase n=1 Tax=Segetibacter sp. 3557_3 TaxID=2547429 RepID=UPI0010589CAE|nr:aminomethyl-transferring glycine dehydrogenase [Segetibacter sp. 3557_3]TDH27982.1 glycine dehydrogenase (aminomethyl-transferring) [Segetibacter sp. 3557_3]
MNIFEQQATEFQHRHIGPNDQETAEMLAVIGMKSMDELIDKTVPAAIRSTSELEIAGPASEFQYLNEFKQVAAKNKVFRSHIGQGYYDTIMPSVILRNLFENPGWYTQYTPYQAEIAQGRLESLLNFQTMVSDLTGLSIANASLLDEGTAAAEAMAMLFNTKNKAEHITAPRFFVDESVFAQTIDVLQTRALPIKIELVIGDFRTAKLDETYFGAIVQYPNSNGSIEDYRDFIKSAHAVHAQVVMATDLLALTLLTPPGELGADVAIGSAQRFGVPMGFGGPHAAFFATKDEFKRVIPGRIIGISIDAEGNRALRMALQTREQHIRREKATSNICTAQALLANIAAMYAVYHGPEGLKSIAKRVSMLAYSLNVELSEMGFEQQNQYFFDTLKVKVDNVSSLRQIAEAQRINFFYYPDNYVGITIDETTAQCDVLNILHVFAQLKDMGEAGVMFDYNSNLDNIPTPLTRTSSFLEHQVFNSHHSESEMMRYLKMLENRDLSLAHSMIPLGSCTMKLNAATQLIPVSWPEFSRMHPFAPADQWEGYQQIFTELEDWLSKITGFAATSLQPNSGAQGEYAGLLAISAYHRHHNHDHRNVILIPISAHGTNPASAVMAGFKVVVTKCDEAGNIDVEDLRKNAEKYKENLAGLMVTYPSTHGVFEESIKDICAIVHEHGGLVYMDGANMNAQVGLTSPGSIGADVCHLNLHKTFSIPHGGGGPGMGPICVNEKLAPFLPGHVDEQSGDRTRKGAVSAARFGSASILLISYAYIKMLGPVGVRRATEYAILNANYMKARLQQHYKILYSGKNNTCAHEFIVDLRPFKAFGVEAEDVAKRLMDYGFHAPTLSFPVPGTIMIEPTESEPKGELDRFCEAMISIHQEIKDIESGKSDKSDNPLKNAPHTQHVICADEWKHSYTRKTAAFPLAYLKEHKFWPGVSRVNNTHGDRNLICTCEPIEAYQDAGVN